MTTLSEVCELIVDSEHKTAPKASDGYPMVRTTDIELGKLNLRAALRVDETAYREWTVRAVPQPDDLILAREAPVGNVGIVPPGAQPCLGQRTVLLRPDRGRVEPRYLNYLLSGPELRGRMEALSNGATVPHLNMRDIRLLELPPLPRLPEQCRIASILAAYDDLIENNTRRIQILEEMAQAIYREWFVELRFPGHGSVRMVASGLGPIPERWRVVQLGEVCERITDGAHNSPPSVPDGYPMASVKDMTPRSLKLDQCRRISARDYEVLVRQDCKPRKGDVLIAKDGSYLKQVFAVEEEHDVVILSSIALLRPTELLDSSFLALSLQQPETRDRLAGYVSGVAIPRIVLKDFKRFPMLLPPAELQHQLKGIVQPMSALALNLERSNLNLRRTRDLLLPRLISGEIDVSNLDIGDAEPAA